MTRCEQCGYYWRDPGEAWPGCHYDGPDEWAPCAQDEESIVEEEE